jgi:hypothetical protein
VSALTDLGNRIRAIYDRVIAFVVVLALLGSLVYLAVQVGTMRGRLRQFDVDIKQMKPRHPHAKVVEAEPYVEGLHALREPFQMRSDTNRFLLIPEKRVWCQGCRRPTPYESERCTFCDKPNVGPTNAVPLDIDNDGMPTKWELTYKFNPNDPSDADEDADGDRFSNLQEFNAGTDPRDPLDHPPVLYLLRLAQIETTPFKMIFVAKSTMPEGHDRFQVNYGGRSYFCKLNETVYSSAVMKRDQDGKLVSTRDPLFSVVAFREKSEERMNPAINKLQVVDISEIDLKPEGAEEVTTLVFKEEKFKYRAILELQIDNQVETLEVGSSFKLRTEDYKLQEMDREKNEVIIIRTHDKRRFCVTPQTVIPLEGT